MAAKAANSSARRCRVSGRLRADNTCRIGLRAEGGQLSHVGRDPCAARAATNSSGNSNASTASSAVQEPSALACSTTARPAAAILPCAISMSILALLIFDQTLFGFRRVNHCSYRSLSRDATRESIHPKHSASSTA